MKTQFTLFKRKSGIFYMKDKLTGKHKSLHTRNRAEAQKLVQAHNDVINQACFNRDLASIYRAGIDPEYPTRTWQKAMDHVVERQVGDNRRRWLAAARSGHLNSIRHRIIAETLPEHFDKPLACRKPAVVEYLRRLHQHALDMSWLPRPLLNKRLWPKIPPKLHRSITADEHERIIEAETAAAQRNHGSRNSDEPHYAERLDFYQLLWHTGASQGDAALMRAENVNWQQRTLCYSRRKLAYRNTATVRPALLRFGNALAAVLERRPRTGPLFPYLSRVRPSDRATEFKQRCQSAGVQGVTLHSYRYGWAERAAACGYPERFAQQALGHNSKAVHRAYAKNAGVIVPSLEDWETHWHATQQPPRHPVLPVPDLPPQPGPTPTPERPGDGLHPA